MNRTTNNSFEAVIEECRKRNPAAQRQLYNAYSAKMFMICLRYAKSREDAEDILQMSFIKVFKNIDAFSDTGSFEGWMRRIVVNTAIENYRKSIHTFEIVTNENAVAEVKDESVFDKLQMEDLMKLINQLPDGYRIVFNMYAIEGYSHKEIAEALNISEGGSKSQLSRARQILRQEIKKMENMNYAKR
ncbi:RNA polymerase subunit sigma-70 [Arachidicoccus ginsenosidimutans]|uniref:RNA polymerase sigma factor n=1 Tax=Arachidicoccus sp. BS20 TaxID=1850526 RepID=UPI0007F0D561|nr:RNA polymerase sigma factor [Arachidicoccus sp. BS20]ANI90134.1 RNA polymerase subunit sigma-70 [Arachidicoccus sp. BS20]